MSTSGGPLSSGSGQSGARGLGGTLEVRTVIVLSSTDTEPAGWAGCRERASEPSATVALRWCLEMSVMEARQRG